MVDFNVNGHYMEKVELIDLANEVNLSKAPIVENLKVI